MDAVPGPRPGRAAGLIGVGGQLCGEPGPCRVARGRFGLGRRPRRSERILGCPLPLAEVVGEREVAVDEVRPAGPRFNYVGANRFQRVGERAGGPVGGGATSV